MFADCIFTYLVGPQKREFMVHEDIVSKTSPVLQAMMTNPMREKEKKVVELPEVDPETFQNFISYAYFHASHICRTKNSEDFLQTSRSKVIELLLLHDHKTFRCKGCYKSPRLKFSLHFPRCQECFDGDRLYANWLSHCTTPQCFETADSLDGLLCKKHLKDYGAMHYSGRIEGDGLEKIQLQCPQTLKTLKCFRFDIPIRAEEIASLMERFTCGLYMPRCGLLEVTRLAIFAELYHIDELLEAACLNLYKALAIEFPGKASIETILNIAKVIYEGTPNTEIKPFDEKHILRRMISEFIASRLDYFILPKPTEAFLDQQQDLFLDVMTVVAEKCGDTELVTTR